MKRIEDPRAQNLLTRWVVTVLGKIRGRIGLKEGNVSLVLETFAFKNVQVA